MTFHGSVLITLQVHKKGGKLTLLVVKIYGLENFRRLQVVFFQIFT